MFRGTKDVMLPTTITGSLPRPSWYTENLGTRHFLEAMVGRRFREQYEDALTCYLRDQELAGLDIVTDGDCRFDDDVGGQSWTGYPANHMSGLDVEHPVATPAGRGGVFFPRGHILHDYLEIAGDAGHHRPDRARRSAIHGDVEGSATVHRPTRQVWRGVSRDRGVCAAGSALQERAGSHVRHRRRFQRRISRAGRCRLPGDPDRRTADSPDRPAQDPGQGHHTAIHGRDLQSHSKGSAREDRSMGAFLLGQPLAAAHVCPSAKLQAGVGDLQYGRRRRDNVRSRQAPAASTSRRSARRSPTRRSRSASSTITSCRSRRRTRWRRKSALRSNTFRPSNS